MNTISIREFQRNMYRYLKELPIVVTKNSNPLFIIQSYIVTEKLESKPITVATIKSIQNIKKKLDKNGFCPHYIQGTGYCRSCGG